MLLQLVLTFFCFVAAAVAQPLCDSLTQYSQDGRCCTMCGPGTSMSSLGSCLEPQCQKCEEDEYQDAYTTKSKCDLQPYCDANRNFQAPVYDVTKRASCVCKDGFHCSSEDCITCVRHTPCKPGYGVKSEGTHQQDTVCEKCSEGFFSPNTSRTDGCQRWTECEAGMHRLEVGTDTSDNICDKNSRTYVMCIVVVVVLLLGLLVAGCLISGKRYGAYGKVKRCNEFCFGETKELPKENKPLGMPLIVSVEESKSPTRQSSQDEPRTPEEVDYVQNQEITIVTEISSTENGELVMHDNEEHKMCI